jgi:hypothetical protein
MYVNSYNTVKKNKNNVDKLLSSLHNLMISDDSFVKYEVLQEIERDNKNNCNATVRKSNLTYKEHKYPSNISRNTKNTNSTKKPSSKYFFTYETNFEVLKYFIDEYNTTQQTTQDNCYTKERNTKLTSKDINNIINQFASSCGELGENTYKSQNNETKNFLFQQYKIKICELISSHSLDIRSLNLNPKNIYENVLSKNACIKKGFERISFNYELDVVFSVLKCLRINFIYLSHKCSFNIYDELNDVSYLIIHDTINTLKINDYLKKHLKTQETINLSSIEHLNSLNNYTLFKLEKGQYEEIIIKIKQNTLLLDNVKKPIKALSYYKVEELRTMSKQLNININMSSGKPKTKQMLYSEISNKTSSIVEL